MRIEDALPALRSGRKARRSSWKAGKHIIVQLIGGVRTDHFTVKDGASESTWSGSQLESRDMLADDWELLAAPEFQPYVPGNFREALDIILSMMSNETFTPYEDVKKSLSYGQSEVEELKADCDWRTTAKAVVGQYLEAASAKDAPAMQEALSRACLSSFKALSYYLAERYVREVMER